MSSIKYRVKPGVTATHAGVEYTEGQFLPNGLSVAEINTHLPFVEIVEEPAIASSAIEPPAKLAAKKVSAGE